MITGTTGTTGTTAPAEDERNEESPVATLPVLATRAASTAANPTGSSAEGPRPWAWGRVKDISWGLLGVFGLLYVAGWALRLFTSVLLLFVLAALLAFIIRSLVTLLEQHLHFSRTAAALASYLVVLLFLGVAGFWGVSRLIEQATALVANLPALYQALQEQVPDLQARVTALGFSIDIAALQSQLLADLQPAGLASHGLAWATRAGDVALNFFLVLFLSFYLVVDGDRLALGLLDISPPSWKPYVRFVQQSLLRVVGGYLRGQLLMGAIVGTSVFVACLVLGVRYSLVLGVLGFFFEMVPMVGPTLIGASMTLVAFFTSLHLALLALGFYLLLQLIESNVLGPRITGHAVGLHPIASLLGLVAGAKLFGLWGTLFAVPVLGFGFVVVAAVYRQVRGLDPIEVLVSRQPHRSWRWIDARARSGRPGRPRAATEVGVGGSAGEPHPPVGS